MKRLFSKIIMIVVLVATISCSDDDNKSSKEVLVTIERSTGKMYSIDTETGATTEIMTITLDGSDFVGIRSFVYDPATKKGYVGSAGTAACDGCFYSVDMKTGEATLLNDNTSEAAPNSLDAISDLLVDGENILGSTWATFPIDELTTDSGIGLIWFNKSTGAYDDYYLADKCCGGALAYGGLTDGVYLGGTGELYAINTTTKTVGDPIILDTDDITPFTTAVPTFTLNDTYIQEFAEDKKGNVYAVVYFGATSQNSGTTFYFFVSITPATGKMTYISTLATTRPAQKHALAFVPESILP
jgi:hypothetical protein